MWIVGLGTMHNIQVSLSLSQLKYTLFLRFIYHFSNLSKKQHAVPVCLK